MKLRKKNTFKAFQYSGFLLLFAIITTLIVFPIANGLKTVLKYYNKILYISCFFFVKKPERVTDLCNQCTFYTCGNSVQSSISSRTLAWLNEKAVNSLGSPHGKAALAPQQLISSLHPLLWEQLNNWHQRVWPEMHAWTYLKLILVFKVVCSTVP